MLLSTFFFSIMQVLVKKLSLPVSEIILFRSGVSFILASIAIHSKGIAYWGNKKRLLILRGLFGLSSLSCFFYALQNAPLGSVVTVVNIKPLLVLIIAFVFLKETIKVQQWVFFIISFIGIVVLKGFDANINTLAFLAILGAAVFASIAHTIVRKLKGFDEPEVIIMYFTLMTFPFVLPFVLLNWQTPSLIEFGFLLGIGVVTHLGQLFLTKAYQSEKIADVSNVYFMGVTFAVINGYLFFNEQYEIEKLTGIGLIIGGIILNAKLGQRDLFTSNKKA